MVDFVFVELMWVFGLLLRMTIEAVYEVRVAVFAPFFQCWVMELSDHCVHGGYFCRLISCDRWPEPLDASLSAQQHYTPDPNDFQK